LKYKELIIKLEELTKPEPKYKAGDDVFITWHCCIEEARIVDRTSHARYQVMLNDGGQVSRIESEIFPTRQALIEHQLQYWSKLYEESHPGDLCLIKRTEIKPVPLSEFFPVFEGEVKGFGYDGHKIEPKPCQHEPDGEVYMIDGFNGSSPSFKCIKCREFYR
jgi:hypothetical protein